MHNIMELYCNRSLGNKDIVSCRHSLACDLYVEHSSGLLSCSCRCTSIPYYKIITRSYSSVNILILPVTKYQRLSIVPAVGIW